MMLFDDTDLSARSGRVRILSTIADEKKSAKLNQDLGTAKQDLGAAKQSLGGRKQEGITR